MRVAIVSPSLSRLAGGIFEIERSLAQALGEIPNVAVSVHGLNDAFVRADLPAWGTLRPETHRSIGPTSFGYAPGLKAGLIKSQADIGHLQALWMYPSIAVHNWAVKARKPYIVTANGMLDTWALRNSAWRKKIAAAPLRAAKLGSSGMSPGKYSERTGIDARVWPQQPDSYSPKWSEPAKRGGRRTLFNDRWTRIERRPLR